MLAILALLSKVAAKLPYKCAFTFAMKAGCLWREPRRLSLGVCEIGTCTVAANESVKCVKNGARSVEEFTSMFSSPVDRITCASGERLKDGERGARRTVMSGFGLSGSTHSEPGNACNGGEGHVFVFGGGSSFIDWHIRSMRIHVLSYPRVLVLAGY